MTVSNGTPPIHYAGRSPSYPDRDVADVRRLTAREVARIQTFRDSYAFGGTKNEQITQIANAVPPVLAKAIGTHIRHSILGVFYEEEQAQSTATTTAD
jgi:DNA (cytosine-5)-methyltransferase 1